MLLFIRGADKEFKCKAAVEVRNFLLDIFVHFQDKEKTRNNAVRRLFREMQCFINSFTSSYFVLMIAPQLMIAPLSFPFERIPSIPNLNKSLHLSSFFGS